MSATNIVMSKLTTEILNIKQYVVLRMNFRLATVLPTM